YYQYIDSDQEKKELASPVPLYLFSFAAFHGHDQPPASRPQGKAPEPTSEPRRPWVRQPTRSPPESAPHPVAALMPWQKPRPGTARTLVEPGLTAHPAASTTPELMTMVARPGH